VRGLPQENYSLPVSVVFDAGVLLVMLSVGFGVVLQSVLCH
jgi:hypothetical protein